MSKKACIAVVLSLMAFSSLVLPRLARAADEIRQPISLDIPKELAGGPQRWTSPEGLELHDSGHAFADGVEHGAILMMTTCFVPHYCRVEHDATGHWSQTLPPNQVLISLAMFITFLVMSLYGNRFTTMRSCLIRTKKCTLEEAWTAGSKPVRRFMSLQIERTGNSDDVLAVLEARARTTTPADELRRRAAASPGAGLHPQRAQNCLF